MSSDFLRAHMDAMATHRRKGKVHGGSLASASNASVLKEMKKILPHVDASLLARQHEVFTLQKFMRTRRQVGNGMRCICDGVACGAH